MKRRRAGEGWRETLEGLWESLPLEVRQALLDAAGVLPADLKRWRALMEQAGETVRVAAGGRKEVVILGPVNVGKSTLYNRLLLEGEPLAQVSPLPGTTRQPSRARAGIFHLVDTPGADAGGMRGEAERDLALRAAMEGDVLVLLLDATRGVGAGEQALYREVLALGKPTVVALNKMDRLAGEAPQAVGRAAAALGLASEQVIAISALKGQGLARLLQALVEHEPGIMVALGEALPAYRRQLARWNIQRAASTAAAIAATPIPIIDFVPLLGVQISMVLGLARIYGLPMTAARAKELMATFGMGLMGRTLFHELSKLGGPPGWALAAAIAAGTTASLGYAASIWFERGEKVTPAEMGERARRVSRAVLGGIKGLRRRAGRNALRGQVGRALGMIEEKNLRWIGDEIDDPD
jgi:GTP-binding protein Era